MLFLMMKFWGFFVLYVIRLKVSCFFRYMGLGIRDFEGMLFMFLMLVEVLVCMMNSFFFVDILIIKVCKSLIFYEKDFLKLFDVFIFLIKILKIILKYLC